MKSNRTFRLLTSTSVLLLCVALGCNPPPAKKVAEEKPQPILGQTTQEIGEWDPNAGRQLREEGGEKVNMLNHLRQGTGYAIHESARLIVKKNVDLFWGFEGRYPKSHEEFMEKVIVAYKVKLPMPMTSCEYQYDVENHALKVVEKEK